MFQADFVSLSDVSSVDVVAFMHVC